MHVTLKYLPWRLGRISTVAASKSGACLRTMPVTAWTKRGCLRPITLIGKSQGNANGEFSATTGKVKFHSGRYGHTLAGELDDGQNFLRRRGDPDFVGRAHFGFRDVAELERQAVGARELHHH